MHRRELQRSHQRRGAQRQVARDATRRGLTPVGRAYARAGAADGGGGGESALSVVSWLVGWLEVGNRGELVSSIVGWFGADRCAWREIDEAAPEFVYSVGYAGSEEPRGHGARVPTGNRRVSAHRHLSSRRAFHSRAADAARRRLDRLQYLGGLRATRRPGAPQLSLHRFRRGEGARLPATSERWTGLWRQLGARPMAQ